MRGGLYTRLVWVAREGEENWQTTRKDPGQQAAYTRTHAPGQSNFNTHNINKTESTATGKAEGHGWRWDEKRGKGGKNSARVDPVAQASHPAQNATINITHNNPRNAKRVGGQTASTASRTFGPSSARPFAAKRTRAGPHLPNSRGSHHDGPDFLQSEQRESEKPPQISRRNLAQSMYMHAPVTVSLKVDPVHGGKSTVSSLVLALISGGATPTAAYHRKAVRFR